MTSIEKPSDSELKSTIFFLVLAAAAFAVLYFLGEGSIALGGIAAASVLAVGISRAIAARAKRSAPRE